MTSNVATFRLRLAAVALAVILSLTAALGVLVLTAALPRSWSDARLWLLLASAALAIGALIGACVAWDAAVSVATSTRSLRRTVASLTARSIASGAVAIAFVGALTCIPNYLRFDSAITLGQIGPEVVGPVGTVAGLAAFALAFGLVMFGLPAAVVVAPIVTVWAWLVRRLGRSYLR